MDVETLLLNELHEFTNEYGSRINARLYAEGIVTDTCPNCAQETVDLLGGFCALCGHYCTQSGDN